MNIRCDLCSAEVTPTGAEAHIRTAHTEVLTTDGDCHYLPTWDTDRGLVTVACTWHRHYWRCPHAGKRPFGGPPVEVDERPSAAEALAFALASTGGARRIVQHRGSVGDGTHANGAMCWCDPAVFEPSGVTS